MKNLVLFQQSRILQECTKNIKHKLWARDDETFDFARMPIFFIDRIARRIYRYVYGLMRRLMFVLNHQNERRV